MLKYGIVFISLLLLVGCSSPPASPDAPTPAPMPIPDMGSVVTTKAQAAPVGSVPMGNTAEGYHGAFNVVITSETFSVDTGDARFINLPVGRQVKVLYRVKNDDTIPRTYSITSYFNTHIADYDSGVGIESFVDAPAFMQDWLEVNGIKQSYIDAANADSVNLLSAMKRYRVETERLPINTYSPKDAKELVAYLLTPLIGTYKTNKMGEITEASGWDGLEWRGGRWEQIFETIEPGKVGGSDITFGCPEGTTLTSNSFAFQTEVAVSTGIGKSAGLRTWWLVKFR